LDFVKNTNLKPQIGNKNFMTRQSDHLSRMRQEAVRIFYTGLQAVEAGAAVKKYCRAEGNLLRIGTRTYDLSQFKNLFVVGAGKASASMGAAIEEILSAAEPKFVSPFGKGGRGDFCCEKIQLRKKSPPAPLCKRGEKFQFTEGMINVKYGHTVPLNRIRLTEAGHPVPDENGRLGAEAVLNIVRNAGPDDLVLCLFSGGGSALLPLPFPGLSLKDKQETIRVLLGCGASIHEINAIRKHMSMIKGGRLAQAAYPASLVSLILSDVVGDDLDVIASGPTVPDSATFQDCMGILNKYNIIKELPESVVSHIRAGISGTVPETPKQGDPAFENTYNLVIGSGIEALLAAKQEAENLGYHTLVLSSMIEGDTAEAAKFHGAVAREILRTGHPLPMPACILSGGETTVKIKGKGIGGRNQEFVLAAAMEINNIPKPEFGNDYENGIVILSGGTDGTDGPTDAAGAIADHFTCESARSVGAEPRQFLSDNDSYHFFKKLDDLLITGPTNTNVMDLRILLVK
jgi:hydroxypyruvate reductase